jgi:hypothetical protein
VSNRGLLSSAKKLFADGQVFESNLLLAALQVGTSVANVKLSCFLKWAVSVANAKLSLFFRRESCRTGASSPAPRRSSRTARCLRSTSHRSCAKSTTRNSSDGSPRYVFDHLLFHEIVTTSSRRFALLFELKDGPARNAFRSSITSRTFFDDFRIIGFCESQNTDSAPAPEGRLRGP